MIDVEKIDVECRKNENHGKTTDRILYEMINDMICNYYRIGGLKLYFTCSEERYKRIYMQKIVDYAFSLNDSFFELQIAEYEKPKMCNKNTLIASVCNFIQPERSKREDSQKCEMRCSEHCGNTVREAQ